MSTVHVGCHNGTAPRCLRGTDTVHAPLTGWSVLAALLLVLPTASVLAQDGPENLRGLPGVSVQVYVVSDGGSRDSSLSSELQTALELKLRQFGVTVLSYQERRLHPSQPRLIVRVGILRDEPEAAFYAVTLGVSQVVHRQGVPPEIADDVMAGIWESSLRIGVTGSSRLVSKLREELNLVAEQFINAFLAANPSHR